MTEWFRRKTAKIKTFDKIVTLNLFELQENKTVQ